MKDILQSEPAGQSEPVESPTAKNLVPQGHRHGRRLRLGFNRTTAGGTPPALSLTQSHRVGIRATPDIYAEVEPRSSCRRHISHLSSLCRWHRHLWRGHPARLALDAPCTDRV